jgi:hypothetical protein
MPLEIGTAPSALGGSISESELAFTDVTTRNASTTQHGLLPKGDNIATNFLNGQLGWSAPAAGIGGSTGATDNAVLAADGAGGATLQSRAVTISDTGIITQTGIALRIDDANSNSIRFTNSIGPTFFESNVSGVLLTLNMSGLTTSRTQIVQNLAGTFALLENKLSAFAATSSAELAGVITNETGSGSLVFANSPALTTPSADFVRQTGSRKRVATQFDKTDATLADVADLSVTVTAGRSYSFRAVLYVNTDAVGGHKYAIAGTATATAIVYQINSINNGSNAFRINSRQTALGGSAGEAVGTAYYTELIGLITVNAGGTLLPQFAQNAANGTSSVLVGSHFILEDIA